MMFYITSGTVANFQGHLQSAVERYITSFDGGIAEIKNSNTGLTQ